jgi:nitroreductase
MNPVMELLLNRKSVRAYEEREISREVKDEILAAAMRSPTAGNLMLYSVIDVKDQSIKDELVKTCDNQAFIAQAPWVLLFLADYQRWYDCFEASGVEQLCRERRSSIRKPEEGDMFLACCDALIAAQTAVVAAESLGVGSCYIGDILESYEIHRQLFDLPPYTVPICLVCFGYPAESQKQRKQTPRFHRKFIVSENRYRRLDGGSFKEMCSERQEHFFGDTADIEGASNFGQLVYLRKFDVGYARERNRSARVILKGWAERWQ